MRILMLCADWGIPVGGNAGSSVHFRSLAKAFVDLGHEVRAVVTNGGGTASLPVPVVTVPHGTAWPRIRGAVERVRGRSTPNVCASGITPLQGRPASSITAETAADFVIGSANDPDHRAIGQTSALKFSGGEVVAHSEGNSFLSDLYYRRLPAIVHLAEELLWHRRRFEETVGGLCSHWRPDIIYERYALCQTGGLSAAQSAGIPMFLEVNSPLHDERCRRGLSASFSALARRDERRLWSQADRVFCVSEVLKARITPLRGHVSQQNGGVFVTPNGVDTELFSPDRRSGALRQLLGLGKETLVGWLGALSHERGAEEFVSIMSGVLSFRPDVHAVLIGGGPLEAELKHRAAEAGFAGRIHFTGGVVHEAVPALLADLDIAVASYPKLENFYFSPMKLYEYMASGLPVVAGNMGQMADVVVHGTSGLLMTSQEQEEWVRAIAELCDAPERRAELGNGARERALAFGSWKGNATLILEQVEALCGRGV